MKEDQMMRRSASLIPNHSSFARYYSMTSLFEIVCALKDES